MSLGLRIKELRLQKELTQQYMAEKLNMGRSNFGHIENDRVTPTSEDLQKIADILETSTDYLLGRSPQKYKSYVSEPSTPSWSSPKDLRDLKKIIEEGDIMFDGVPLDSEKRQRVMDVLTGLFWEAKKMNKKTYGRKKNNKNNTSDED